ncbi:MAG: UDP-glucose 4-epimerase GalE [Bacteroidetes bacterium]|nr:UDP-glucose 4-epimerase GalE [Bacteroidota bacterium]
MKILVTGGTGYIGSHTVVELQQSGHEVVIVDNLSNSYASVVDQIEKITGIRPAFESFDLADPKKTLDFFDRHRDLGGVIHFAAYKAVGESMTEPLKYYHNNLSSLINILKGMQKAGVTNLVFSSSCTVYGQPDVLPVTESAPIKEAWSPYGHTKQISEKIIENTSRVNEINGILLRYFNPIGAHESALIGELPIGIPNNLVPFITQTAIGLRDKLRVFGDDYDTPDGTAIRDYIHVVDLAKAHVVAIDRMLKGKNKKQVEIFNLGTGKGFSVLDVIHSFEKVSAQKLNYEIVARRPGDVEKVWADTRFANEVLGWNAGKSLDDMMLSAWNWELALKKAKA